MKVSEEKRQPDKEETVSKETWQELNKLTEKQLRNLADIIGVGINDPIDDSPLDNEELVMILSTEPEDKVKEGLTKLKESMQK